VPDEVLAEVRSRSRQARERVLKVVDELSDAQLAWRPAPKAHSIGWILWHVARADDNVQADLGGRDTIWTSDRYAARWGHPERGVGTGWDDEAAAALPLPARAELLEYVRRVFAACDAAADAIDASRFAATHPSRFMSREATFGDVLLTGITHDNRHLGEMEYIKGLLGLRGSVTV
jgi:uncharacterized damage-inducible protein DinB